MIQAWKATDDMILYAFTIFTSAFLLFQVQPLIGKWILPWFGGTPAVWTTCMLFFQVLLFAGYAYAHVLQKLTWRRQALVHGLLLGATLLVLPIIPGAGWKPEGAEDPVLRILLILGGAVGLPYFCLSATSPLLQAWFGRACPGRKPYALYALSNAGSLLALVSYPFVFEPVFRLRVQAVSWSWGYAGFAVLCGVCVWVAAKSRTDTGFAPVPAAAEAAAGPETRPAGMAGGRRVVFWFCFPAVSSIMLLAFTNQMCMDIATIPFLWILPLGVYLLSYILTFSGERFYRRPFHLSYMAVGMLFVVALLSKDNSLNLGLLVLYYTAALFFCCMVCHGELYRLRPEPARLTAFYLTSSGGSALGGILAGVAAPLLFPMYLELHAGLLLCGALALACLFTDPACRLYRGRPRWVAALLIAALLGLGVGLSRQVSDFLGGNLAVRRNFFGVLRVYFCDVEGEDGRERQIRLCHGTTDHGMQFRDETKRQLPVSYYAPSSGIGLAVQHCPQQGPRRIGVVGLGAGTIAAWGRPGAQDVIRFYEINEQVRQLANEYFTYLKDSHAIVEIKMGDARLSLEEESRDGMNQRFDILALDAFSSDAIPVHLLTREAFVVYLRHLKPDGILAVHITNHHLNLNPVIAALADQFHLAAIGVSTDKDSDPGAYLSEWVLLTNNRVFLANPEVAAASEPLDVKPASRVLWTDDYSNLFRVLKKNPLNLRQWSSP